jgi:hypothetical protein
MKLQLDRKSLWETFSVISRSITTVKLTCAMLLVKPTIPCFDAVYDGSGVGINAKPKNFKIYFTLA